MAPQQDTTDADDETDSTLRFAGLTRFVEGRIPEEVFGHDSSMKWWAREWSGTGENPDEEDEVDLPDAGFNSVVDQLPRATTAEVQWVHPRTGETYRTAKHNAVIDPDRAEQINGPFGTYADILQEYADESLTDEEAATAVEEQGFENAVDQYVSDPEDRGRAKTTSPGDDALYHIPTDDYEVVNPSEILRPLAEVIREQDLGEDLFGEARLYRAGGKVSLDVFFNGKTVEWPAMEDDRKPVVVGMQIDYDHFGGTSVNIQGMGMDWECTNALRSITGSETVKHAGDIDSRVEWKELYEDLLETLDLKTDQLSQVIHEASNEFLDMSDLPDDLTDVLDHREVENIWQALYKAAGLPGYLAKHAGDNLRAEASDPYEPSWWEIHRGATYAISHYSRSDTHAGSSIDQQNRTANDMLLNPEQIIENVDVAYHEKKEDTTLSEEGGGAASLRRVQEGLAEKREEYEERQDMIEQIQAANE